MPRNLPQLSLAVLIFMSSFGAAHAQAFMTQEQALRAAFPNGETIDRQTLFLSAAQVDEIQKRGRAKLESQLVIYYRATHAGKAAGYAFFETTIVRTKPATIMAVINPDSSLRAVTILSFYEPQDYLPAPRWFNLFRGKFLRDGLWPRRDIHHLSGATLSVNALTLAARRLLAIFIVAVPKEPQP